MSGTSPNTREGKEKAAAERECVIVEPREDQLFIDIDREEDRKWFDEHIERIRSKWPCAITITPSPSGEPHHEHIVVTFLDGKKLTKYQRIAMQCVLGSDLHRELNSVIDILLGDDLPTIFFEKKAPEQPAKPDQQKPLYGSYYGIKW